MALNVGPDFKQRWLDVPEAVRQAFIDDLSRICEVLTPEANLEHWLIQNDHAQQASLQKIEDAYAIRKAELIEAARIRKQQALEQALEKKRAEEQAYAEQLRLDEERRFAEQTQKLNLLSSSIALETKAHVERYAQNPSAALSFGNLDDAEIRSELENVRLRLELEAETQIEQHLKTLRQQLKQAAKEEINYLLTNANFEQRIPETSEN